MSAPPAVRVLPMSLEEFRHRSAAEVQQDYFGRVLRAEHGRYRFYERGLRAEEGTVVLFQYDNAIIAAATLVYIQRYPQPDQDGCHGHFVFDPATIWTFDPVDKEQMRSVWPDFEGFDQVRQDLDAGRYQKFLRLTLKGATIAESLVRAMARVVRRDRDRIFSRAEVRVAANVTRGWWTLSWNPIFQGMRADHPGRAPVQAERHQGILRRVAHGKFILTDRGWALVRPAVTDKEDGDESDALQVTGKHLEQTGYFDADDERDERERRRREIVQRRGQPAFRRRLLHAYDGKCAFTGCDAKPALEAAHITRFLGDKSHAVTNGLLLRSDIHTLFDLNLVGIHPGKLTIALTPNLRGTVYEKLAGMRISSPADPRERPSAAALQRRWRAFKGFAT